MPRPAGTVSSSCVGSPCNGSSAACPAVGALDAMTPSFAGGSPKQSGAFTSVYSADDISLRP
ncbi:MAG: hypothetical protein AB1730_09110 [Myxococcota bacterium]|jgi:hypothetical protein